MANPSDVELEAVKEFRRLTSDIPQVSEYSTLQCLAWLRARDLNVFKASEMLRAHLVWRKEVEIDKIMDYHPPEHFLVDYVYDIPGTDNEGHPIVILPAGDWDIAKCVNMGESKDGLKFVIQLFEKVLCEMKKSSDKLGKEVTQFTWIVDFENFSMRQAASIGTINLIMQILRMFEANYPETLFSVSAINASKIFYILFTIVKPLLTARTLDKVKIYTTPDKWHPALLENIPVSVLHERYKRKQTGCMSSALL